MGFTSTAGLGLRRLVARGHSQILSPTDQEGGAATSLIQALEASDRFRRDGRLGRIFHPGKVSYREISPSNSLHVLLSGGRISAHLDDISPLRCNPDGSAHYSWLPVIRHNAAGLVAELGRRLHGVHGQQRCNLVCETVWVDDEGISELVAAAAEPESEGCEGDESCEGHESHHAEVPAPQS